MCHVQLPAQPNDTWLPVHAPSGQAGPPHGASSASAGSRKLHAEANRSLPGLMVHNSVPPCMACCPAQWHAVPSPWAIRLGGSSTWGFQHSSRKPYVEAWSHMPSAWVGSYLALHVAFCWSASSPMWRHGAGHPARRCMDSSSSSVPPAHHNIT